MVICWHMCASVLAGKWLCESDTLHDYSKEVSQSGFFCVLNPLAPTVVFWSVLTELYCTLPRVSIFFVVSSYFWTRQIPKRVFQDVYMTDNNYRIFFLDLILFFILLILTLQVSYFCGIFDSCWVQSFYIALKAQPVLKSVLWAPFSSTSNRDGKRDTKVGPLSQIH